MQFLYDALAGRAQIEITGENHRYLFKVRRFGAGEVLALRNLRDDRLYRYRIDTIGKRDASLSLVGSEMSPKRGGRLHLIWCMIEPKTIEKSLPMLNQLGVAKITFVYCERSQKNFRVDFGRWEKILVNSCQQCGRSDLMELEILPDLDTVLQRYEGAALLDFGGETQWRSVDRVILGCEGGFSPTEREKLQNSYKIGFKSDLILKSETAAVTIAAKLLI